NAAQVEYTMNVDNPRKTRSGCSHQTSGRVVSPNDRRGNAAVPFISRPLLQLAAWPFSMLPNCPARSRDCRSLPPSKRLPQYSHGNHSRNKRLLASRDRVHSPAFAAPAKKCDARRERARSSIPAANEHRQSASARPVYSVHAHSSAEPLPVRILWPATLSFDRSDTVQTLNNRFEYKA